ncbi:hypothetical protein [Chryseobacterium daeguense]|uniref:hypothetical protein n=1 Tax=Chryseobacterium daeguense TaxID=412438 RepID=UPI00041D840A|nr:hypothetical protein [Chryseobacterium daeguense]
MKGETTIDDGTDLNNVLNQGSELWKNSKSHEGFTVVLHACRTGRCTVDKQGNVIDPVASEISESKEMNGVTIIAPDERDAFTANGKELGPRESTNVDHNGNPLPGKTHKDIKSTHKQGYWNSFQNGQRTNQQSGDTKPEGKDQRSLWDRIFN